MRGNFSSPTSALIGWDRNGQPTGPLINVALNMHFMRLGKVRHQYGCSAGRERDVGRFRLPEKSGNEKVLTGQFDIGPNK